MYFDYAAAAAIGLLVGTGELVSRYRDAPSKALLTLPALLYLGLNAAAAVAALFALAVFGWLEPPAGTSATGARVMRVMAAGFGAMAIFRSSLFVVRMGDQDVPIGPGAFLQVVIGAADRAVDRIRATARAKAVMAAMAGVDFVLAYAALPALCLALMQSLSSEDQQTLSRQTEALSRSQMDPEAKSLVLGLALINAVGTDVLFSAVRALASTIKVIAAIDLKSVEPMKVGQSRRLVVEARDVFGVPIPRKMFQWATSDGSIVSVDPFGEIRALGAGNADITAIADGKSARISVQVNA